jgi:hypothetical protein
MEIKQQAPMNRTTVTIVGVVLLCGAGLAYSQGWFDSLTSSFGGESNRGGTEQLIEKEETKPVGDKATTEQTAPAKTPAK